MDRIDIRNPTKQHEELEGMLAALSLSMDNKTSFNSKNIQTNSKDIDKFITNIQNEILKELNISSKILQHKHSQAIIEGIKKGIDENTKDYFELSELTQEKKLKEKKSKEKQSDKKSKTKKKIKGKKSGKNSEESKSKQKNSKANNSYLFYYSKVYMHKKFFDAFETSKNKDINKTGQNEFLNLLSELGNSQLSQQLLKSDLKQLSKLQIPPRILIHNMRNNIIDEIEKKQKFKSHIQDKHIDKSLSYLMNRVKEEELSLATCFNDKQTATKAVQENLIKNINDIEKWLNNKKSTNSLVIECEHPYSIGKGLKKGESEITYNFKKSRLVLSKNSSSELGFAIITGFVL